ncbi:MAG: thiamine pyrophosphate-dependent dehydrogenase E1 component subunit alpha [Alphaproteobacteria bacterium]|nr:thiamine pyrophosphate-dependent dehydrogenase E1 component subunit alpha [Alphaproteobacteria bacterium]
MPATKSSRPKKADPARLYRAVRRIRRVEEEVARIYPSDKIKSPVHLSIGQEGIAVGVCDPLEPRDAVSGTYRGHATYLAKGGDLNAMMAELFGKDTGCARGKGGSMHLVDMKANVLGCSAVVGTTVPVAAGFAMAQKMRKTGAVVACFLGDGASEEGCFPETLNFAALHKLPVIFVCENNGFAIHEPLAKRWATTKLCERVRTYGIPATRFTDSDTAKIRDHIAKALPAMRKGGGPIFLECLTWRWREHVGPGEDYDAGFRSKADLAKWQKKDPVVVLGKKLDKKLKATIDAEIEAELAAAVNFAETSPWPDAKELYSDVFA